MTTLKEQLNGYIATGKNVPCKKIYDDVKEKVLEFEKYLDENVWKKEENIIFFKFREIVGDFEK